MRPYTRLFILAGSLLLLSRAPLSALQQLRVEAGLVYQVNSQEDSAPSPLMPAVGVVLPWGGNERWHPEIGLLTFGTYYRLEGDRALPAELEQREFWVQGLLAAVRLGPDFKLKGELTLGLRGGLALLLRLPVPLAGAGGDFGGLTSYFYGGLRLIYPEAGLFAALPVQERLTLRLSVRAGIPVFHLWDGEGAPFTDQLLTGLLLGFDWRLP
jgi:hypothetical protein